MSDDSDDPLDPREPQSAEEQHPPGPAADRAQGHGSKRVLLVDDDPETQYLYQQVLEYGGFEVSLAANGQEAVVMAREHLPDLILMDIHMPIMGGWEASEILKAGETTRHIPIVAISASMADGKVERAEATGMEAFFSKPFPPMMVLAAVQRFFGISDES